MKVKLTPDSSSTLEKVVQQKATVCKRKRFVTEIISHRCNNLRDCGIADDCESKPGVCKWHTILILLFISLMIPVCILSRDNVHVYMVRHSRVHHPQAGS